MCRHITHVIHESSGGYVDIGIAEQLWQDCHAHLFGHHQQTVHLLIEGGWACYVVAQVQHHAHTVVGGGGASETVERLESGGHIAAIDAAYGVAIHPSVSLPSRPSALLVLIAVHEGREMVCRHILLFQRFAGYPVDMIGCHLCGEGAIVQHEDGLMVMAHEGIQESFGGIMGHTYGISQTPHPVGQVGLCAVRYYSIGQRGHEEGLVLDSIPYLAKDGGQLVLHVGVR